MSKKIALEKSELSDGGIIVSKDLDAIKPKCIIIQDDATVKICSKNGKTMIMVEPKDVNEEEHKFKKGDIIFLNVQGNNKIYQHLAIIKSIDKDKGVYFSVSFCINEDELSAIHESMWFSKEYIKSIRYATEEEKRTLFLAMLNKGLFLDEKKMKVRTLKDGDIITIKDKDGYVWYFIFKEIKDEKVYSYASLCKSSNICFGGKNPLCHIIDISSIGFSTTEERQTLFDKIEKQEHKKWNILTKKFENIRWRSKKGENFWCVNEFMDIEEHFSHNGYTDIYLFSVGNYFQTKELAEAAANKIKELLSKL